MKCYDSRMQTILKTFGIECSTESPLLALALIEALKIMFPQYIWTHHFKHHLDFVHICIICGGSLVFTCDTSDKQYNAMLLNFVQNFILNEKIELLFKEN